MLALVTRLTHGVTSGVEERCCAREKRLICAPLIAYVKSCDMTRWTSTNEQKIPPASFHYVSLDGAALGNRREKVLDPFFPLVCLKKSSRKMPWYLCFSHLMTGSFAPGEAAIFGNLQAEKKASKAHCNWGKRNTVLCEFQHKWRTFNVHKSTSIIYSLHKHSIRTEHQRPAAALGKEQNV